jgi:hypothetical protein
MPTLQAESATEAKYDRRALISEARWRLGFEAHKIELGLTAHPHGGGSGSSNLNVRATRLPLT